MKTSPHFETLINQIRKGEVILWIGSGFSKPSGFLLGSELVNKIKKKVNETDISFFSNKGSLDDISEEFVQLYKRENFERILQEEFGKKPESLKYQQQVEKIPQITKIITTNYDTCFEQVYGNKLCKIVFDTDIVKCSKITKVNFFKIHGDIEIPQTIIITKSDYAKFYNKGHESLLWNEIRALITKSSVLFIGYSFEDTNVKLIFDDVLEKLGSDHRDFFLISPSLPSHKQDYLKEKYSIKYIDMTVEKAIPKILRIIEKFLIEDVRMGHIKPPFLNEALARRKIDIDFSCNPDGSLIIKSIKGEHPIKCGIKYSVSKENFNEIVELQDLIQGKKFGEIALSSSRGKLDISTKMGPSVLFNTESAKKVDIKIKSNPRKKIKADLCVKGTELSLECLTGEQYSSPHAFRIDLHYTGFDIFITGTPKEFKTFSYGVHINNVIQGYKIFKILREWVEGKPLQIFFESAENPLDISIDKVELDSKNIDFIKWNFNLFSSLSKIQQKFEIIFQKPFPISEKEYENILLIGKLLDGDKVKIDPVECTIKPVNYDIFLKTLEDTSEVITINMPKLSYRILNKELSLENCSIEIHDMVYQNIEEIKDQVQERKEFLDLIIGSKTGSIFMTYNTK
jgi:hypothetical protein